MQLCNTLVRLLDAITGISWLEAIKTVASIGTVAIAFLALRNWQRQDKAKREAEFLDALIEASYTYIVEIARPISLVEGARIGMMSHAPLWGRR